MTVEKNFYVSMTDTFMSGWGYAKDKINKYIIGCDTMEEAEIIKANAQDRSDMKNIRICMRKPRYNTEKYLVTWKDKEECINWLEKDFFKNRA